MIWLCESHIDADPTWKLLSVPFRVEAQKKSVHAKCKENDASLSVQETWSKDAYTPSPETGLPSSFDVRHAA